MQAWASKGPDIGGLVGGLVDSVRWLSIRFPTKERLCSGSASADVKSRYPSLVELFFRRTWGEKSAL